jgi:hypothetical protein
MGPRTIEKSTENPHFIFCCSFPNLRLGWEHEASLTHTKIWEGRTSMSEGAFDALENRGSVISGSVF